MLYNIIDFTKPFGIIVALGITSLSILFGKELKKSSIPAGCLVLFLICIIIHTIQYLMLEDQYFAMIAKKSLSADAIMIFLSYMSYLWIDDIETKEKNKKSVDSSLEWFWKKI